MKLLAIDYILLAITILLLLILYHLIVSIDDEGLLYNRESLLTKLCRKEHNINNPNYKFRLLLNEKLYVKEFNQKYLPDIKFSKNLFVFDDPNELHSIHHNLPEKYVIKYSIGTGRNIVVDSKISIDDLVDRCKFMERDVKNHNTHPHEAHCYDIVSKIRKPKFLIEEYIGDNLIDYKFYYINGNYIFLLIMGDRYSGMTGIEKGSKKGEEGHIVYYTTYDDMGILSEKIYHAGKNLDYKDPPFKLPKNFGIMKEYCQKFCEFTEINFVRIDFYEVNGEVYFGEYTFVPNLCIHKLNTQYEKYLIDKYNLKV
tara:strand:+ start:522 stop:1457 length:936 start_codon:yes stop_codon:yes gene_type:complete